MRVAITLTTFDCFLFYVGWFYRLSTGKFYLSPCWTWLLLGHNISILMYSHVLPLHLCLCLARRLALAIMLVMTVGGKGRE